MVIIFFGHPVSHRRFHLGSPPPNPYSAFDLNVRFRWNFPNALAVAHQRRIRLILLLLHHRTNSHYHPQRYSGRQEASCLAMMMEEQLVLLRQISVI